MKFTKKPVTIDAVKWTGENVSEIETFTNGAAKFAEDHERMIKRLAIPTLEGNHEAKIGDMIIKGVASEFYPCKPDIFEQTYTEGESDPGIVPIGSFSWALMRLKEGAKVARRGWNGTGMFAYYVPGGTYPAQTEAIKGVFPDDMVPYRPYYALKTAQNDVATWTPSGSDTLAEDWEEIE